MGSVAFLVFATLVILSPVWLVGLVWWRTKGVKLSPVKRGIIIALVVWGMIGIWGIIDRGTRTTGGRMMQTEYGTWEKRRSSTIPDHKTNRTGVIRLTEEIGPPKERD